MAQARAGAGHASAAAIESIAGSFRAMHFPLLVGPGGAIHIDRYWVWRLILRCIPRVCPTPAAMQSRRWRSNPATEDSAQKRAAEWLRRSRATAVLRFPRQRRL